MPNCIITTSLPCNLSRWYLQLVTNTMLAFLCQFHLDYMLIGWINVSIIFKTKSTYYTILIVFFLCCLCLQHLWSCSMEPALVNFNTLNKSQTHSTQKRNFFWSNSVCKGRLETNNLQVMWILDLNIVHRRSVLNDAKTSGRVLHPETHLNIRLS